MARLEFVILRIPFVLSARTRMPLAGNPFRKRRPIVPSRTAYALCVDPNRFVVPGLAACTCRAVRSGRSRSSERREFSPSRLPRSVRQTHDAGYQSRSSGLIILRTYRQKLDAAVNDQLRQLSREALTDNLTKIGNHRAYQEALNRGLDEARTTGEALTLAMIDVDEFKLINDTNGHSYGDNVLSVLGTLLTRLRSGDQISAYRIGGDEFALILPGIPLADARGIISRQRDTCCSAKLDVTHRRGQNRSRADRALFGAAGSRPP